MTTVCERISLALPDWLKSKPECRLTDKCLLIFYIILIVLILIAIISFVCIGSLWLKVANERNSIQGYMKPQCAEDGFKTVNFFVKDRYGNQVPKHVKILALNDGDAGAYAMNFHHAEDLCNRLNSTLWEVSGEEEWNAVINALNEMNINVSVWLNGRAKNNNDNACNVSTDCLKTEALKGKGISIEWRTDKRMSEYSRLFQGETEDGGKCIYVQDVNNMLWNVDRCAESNHVLLCVKKDCFV